jgi:GNAT superfamily N-acetyltransferase
VTTVEVRLASGDDLDALVQAFAQPAFFGDRVERQLAGLGELFVAWHAGAPVGNVYLRREEPEEEPVRRYLGHTPTLNHLEVAPAFQNQGIGTTLVHAAEECAAWMGYLRACLGVGVSNHGARRLYQRLGYRDWGHGTVEISWVQESDGSTQYDTCDWMVKDLPNGAPGLDHWNAWTPWEAAPRLQATGVPWYVAAGWAIDLHLGRQTRSHEDLEVAISRSQQRVWRSALRDFEFYDAGAGRIRRLLDGDDPDPAGHQMWLYEPSSQAWRMDTFLESGDETTWVSHRDERIRAPMSHAIRRTADGIPYLRPELVLLGKAKHRREKDESDLRATLPTLDEPARRWLVDALSTAHPDHPWIKRLV